MDRDQGTEKRNLIQLPGDGQKFSWMQSGLHFRGDLERCLSGKVTDHNLGLLSFSKKNLSQSGWLSIKSVKKLLNYSLRYSLVFNIRHAVIVDTAKFKGPKLTLSQLFDSTTEILLIGFASTTEQITLISIKICWEIIELWSYKSSSLPSFCQVCCVFYLVHRELIWQILCLKNTPSWKWKELGHFLRP